MYIKICLPQKNTWGLFSWRWDVLQPQSELVSSKHIQQTKPQILPTKPATTLIQKICHKFYTTRRKQGKKEISILNPCQWMNVSGHQVVQLALGSDNQTAHLQFEGLPHRGSVTPNIFSKKLLKKKKKCIQQNKFVRVSTSSPDSSTPSIANKNREDRKEMFCSLFLSWFHLFTVIFLCMARLESYLGGLVWFGFLLAVFWNCLCFQSSLDC